MMVEKMMIENDDDGCKNEKSPPLFSRGLFNFVFCVWKNKKRNQFFSPALLYGKVTLRARKKKKNN